MEPGAFPTAFTPRDRAAPAVTKACRASSNNRPPITVGAANDIPPIARRKRIAPLPASIPSSVAGFPDNASHTIPPATVGELFSVDLPNGRRQAIDGLKLYHHRLGNNQVYAMATIQSEAFVNHRQGPLTDEGQSSKLKFVS